MQLKFSVKIFATKQATFSYTGQVSILNINHLTGMLRETGYNEGQIKLLYLC